MQSKLTAHSLFTSLQLDACDQDTVCGEVCVLGYEMGGLVAGHCTLVQLSLAFEYQTQS